MLHKVLILAVAVTLGKRLNASAPPTTPFEVS